ncbi:MAG: hypothetical protein ACO1OG_00705 [Devosia sp.]
MRPHPLFKDWSIPTVHVLGDFTLRILTVNDVDRDLQAVLESAAEIKSAPPGSTWPQGLTRHDNLLDLAWHQREFESKRSFTWVIEDHERTYLGCLYVYPALDGSKAADVHWWWRTGQLADRGGFRVLIEQWLAGPDWPRLAFKLPES